MHPHTVVGSKLLSSLKQTMAASSVLLQTHGTIQSFPSN
jgi:hypothetical protein